jgi:hypothetical protein
VRTIVLTLGQGAGALLALAGLYALVGVEWAALVGGVVLLALCTLAEALPPRPHPAGPAPGESSVTELPGAARSRPREG